MSRSAARVDWALFILLGFLWGSSYLFIKIGVDAGLTPFTLVATRLLFGFLLLASVVVIAREALPRRLTMYGHLLVMAVLSVALPFVLITWAEQGVDSTLAATLNASVPLFTIPHRSAGTGRREGHLPTSWWASRWASSGWSILVGFDAGVLAADRRAGCSRAHRLIHFVRRGRRLCAALRVTVCDR